MNTQTTPQMVPWRVIDFATEQKEYERWLNASPLERLRAARKIRKMADALQQRPRRAFQPVVAVIKR